MSDSNNTASLGCGSLILIALIVMFFSRYRGHNDMDRELTKLRNEMRQVHESIDRLDRSQEISLSPDELRAVLDSAVEESERERVQALLPKYRAIYAKLLPEDPFKDGSPKTLDELLAPMREITGKPPVEEE